MTNYEKQLLQFKQHLDSCFTVLLGETETAATNEIFHNAEFTIVFMGKTVTLCNTHENFQAIEKIIDNELLDLEENK